MSEASAFEVDSSYGRAGPESIKGRAGRCVPQLWMVRSVMVRSVEVLKEVGAGDCEPSWAKSNGQLGFRRNDRAFCTVRGSMGLLRLAGVVFFAVNLGVIF